MRLSHARLTQALPPRTGDYCDVYLTHDSMSVRKAHNSGRNHLRNVVDYYQREQRPPLSQAPFREATGSRLTQSRMQRSATRRPSPSSTRSHHHTPPRAKLTPTRCCPRTSLATASRRLRSPSPAAHHHRSPACLALLLASFPRVYLVSSSPTDSRARHR